MTTVFYPRGNGGTLTRDQLTALAVGNSNRFTFDDGNDSLTLTGGGSANTITLGKGNDTRSLSGDRSNELTLGGGNFSNVVVGHVID
jgi:hypothetical protein